MKIRIHKPIYGVPITYLSYHHCPDQFEIIGRSGDIDWAENNCDFFTPPTKEQSESFKKQDKTWRVQNPYLLNSYGNFNKVYTRLFIKRKL